MENNLFCNSNGNVYYILFGQIGERAFLCNIESKEYVICKLLEENNWWHGNYYCDFEEAYKEWKEI